MAKKKFTVPQAPGSSRASDRIYTHAIICKFDAEAFTAGLQQRIDGCDNAANRSNYGHYSLIVRVGIGGVWSKREGYTVDEKMLDGAKKRLEEFGSTWEAWLERCQQAERKATEKRLAESDGEFHVLQWSMSEANARKALGSHVHPYRKELQVVPCVQVVK